MITGLMSPWSRDACEAAPYAYCLRQLLLSQLFLQPGRLDTLTEGCGTVSGEATIDHVGALKTRVETRTGARAVDPERHQCKVDLPCCTAMLRHRYNSLEGDALIVFSTLWSSSVAEYTTPGDRGHQQRRRQDDRGRGCDGRPGPARTAGTALQGGVDVVRPHLEGLYPQSAPGQG